jgi:YggT family protein
MRSGVVFPAGRFPNIDWMRQPFSILRQITDPYLNLFRNLIPPIMGMIDFTPILGFMVGLHVESS